MFMSYVVDHEVDVNDGNMNLEDDFLMFLMFMFSLGLAHYFENNVMKNTFLNESFCNLKTKMTRVFLLLPF